MDQIGLKNNYKDFSYMVMIQIVYSGELNGSWNAGQISFASWVEDGHFFSVGVYSTDYDEHYGNNRNCGFCCRELEILI